MEQTRLQHSPYKLLTRTQVKNEDEKAQTFSSLPLLAVELLSLSLFSFLFTLPTWRFFLFCCISFCTAFPLICFTKAADFAGENSAVILCIFVSSFGLCLVWIWFASCCLCLRLLDLLWAWSLFPTLRKIFVALGAKMAIDVDGQEAISTAGVPSIPMRVLILLTMKML